MEQFVRRLSIGTALLTFTALLGTCMFHMLGAGRWTWFECLYHTVITISTVGYGELPDIEHVRYARAFTLCLIVMGTGSLVYVASNVTALIVEGDLQTFFRRNRMRKGIENLKNHVIVCGAGRTGMHVIGELRATRTPFIAIDTDLTRLEHAADERPGMTYLKGDATEDEVLLEAGIARARGVVAALSDDRDNLYVTLTARSLNPSLRIIARAIDPTAEPKLRKAGADGVVSTHVIGGTRLASEMIRPQVTAFLDIMLRDPEHTLRIEEVAIPEKSVMAGRSLATVNLRKLADVLVVAIRSPDGKYKFNPGADQSLTPGATLIVLGELHEIEALRKAV